MVTSTTAARRSRTSRFTLSALAAAALAAAGGSSASAQVYDANDAFVANELSANETNSVFGPFSVGYGNALDDGPFTLFVPGEHTNNFAGNANTQGFITNNNVIVPGAAVNVSATDPGFANLQPGEIILHPGGRGADGFQPPYFDGTLRFTAPVAGVYDISGNFRSIAGGATLNQILVNGVSVVSLMDEGPFSLTRTLNVGDTVDFAVNEAGDGIGSDSTALTATLAIPEPASLDLVGAAGALGLMTRRRRRH